MKTTLTFLGAAQTVTGSKFLLRSGAHRVLVDCGLFQGLKSLRQLNWEPLPDAAQSIDAVVLTHAHLDHTGFLPRLVAQGFAGRVFCTPGTKDLCHLVLPDAGRIQEEDARRANKHGYSRHRPALPLFDEAAALRALDRLQPVGYRRPVPVAPGIDVEFVPAGHLLGSAYARVTLHEAGLTVLFGGDLGRYDRPVLPDPAPVASADVLLVESTYGDRDHLPDDEGEKLAGVINDTAGRGGKVVIPSFAIGRVEEVIYWLKRLEDEARIPKLPVYLDSPMAIEALAYYRRHVQELDPEVRPEGRAVEAFCTSRFETVETPQESKDVMNAAGSSIIISSSGMATGGRVLHHLKRMLPFPRHTVLFVGYQAAGTRGRALLEKQPSVRIHGEDVPVAARVEKLDGLSAHADQSEILRWLGGFDAAPAQTFLVHGEPRPMEVLAGRIRETLGWRIHVPERGERVVLDAGS